jgi:hypothetical protein
LVLIISLVDEQQQVDYYKRKLELSQGEKSKQQKEFEKIEDELSRIKKDHKDLVRTFEDDKHALEDKLESTRNKLEIVNTEILSKTEIFVTQRRELEQELLEKKVGLENVIGQKQLDLDYYYGKYMSLEAELFNHKNDYRAIYDENCKLKENLGQSTKLISKFD